MVSPWGGKVGDRKGKVGYRKGRENDRVGKEYLKGLAEVTKWVFGHINQIKRGCMPSGIKVN